GDPRRTKRLVQLTSDMADNASNSIVKACSSSAKIEAAYRFIRNKKVPSTRAEQQNRTFEEKETYRWKACFDEVKSRLGDVLNVINICDREADIYEYLDYHITHHHRFLVRAKENRILIEPNSKLKALIKTSPKQCDYTVDVKQRGGRKGRKAHMMLMLSFVEKQATILKSHYVGYYIRVKQSIAQKMR
ncbi:MAG: hypothetical protein JKX90_06810, partial [Colwellia sp.]|nr:hypothetical protein [Colwellia sp.]